MLLQHLFQFHGLHAEVIVLDLHDLPLQALHFALVVDLCFRKLAIEALDLLQHAGPGSLRASKLPAEVIHHLVPLLLLL